MDLVILDGNVANLFELVNPSSNLLEDITQHDILPATPFEFPTLIQALLPLLLH
jgi:hypothetical protein